MRELGVEEKERSLIRDILVTLYQPNSVDITLIQGCF